MKSVLKVFVVLTVVGVFAACTTKSVAQKGHSEKRTVAQVGAGSGGSGDIDSGDVDSSEVKIDDKDAAAFAHLIGKLLVDGKTPKQVKDLLNKVVSGQALNYHVAIIKAESDSALGSLTTIFDVGVDELADSDSGWSTVYRVKVKQSRGSKGTYKIKEVTIEGVAG